MDFKKVKVFLFDLDGTVYLDGNLIGDVKNTLRDIRDKGYVVGFLTNNSSKTDKEYLKKLKRLKIFNSGDFFYSSLDSAIDHIKAQKDEMTVYALATKKVKSALKKQGVKLSNNGKGADTVLLTFDKELNYNKLKTANYLLVKKAKYIATHPDSVCPFPEVNIPDAGSFIKLLKESSGRAPDIIVGKPFKTMAENIARRLNASCSEICMVGDRLYTDIAFGNVSGLKTVLVLSGETKREDLIKSKLKPDIVIEDVNELKNLV